MNQMEGFRYPDGDTIAASDVKNFAWKEHIVKHVHSKSWPDLVIICGSEFEADTTTLPESTDGN